VREVARIDTSGRVFDLLLQDDVLYVTAGTPGEPGSDLEIYDVEDPASPMLVTRARTIGPGSLAWDAERIFVRTNVALEVIDVDPPSAPRSLDVLAFPALVWDVDAYGGFLLGVGSTRLFVYDVGAAVPELVTDISVDGHNGTVAIDRTRAVVALNSGVREEDRATSGITVIDLGDPVRPRAQGFTATPGDPRALDIVGTQVYVADGVGGLTSVSIRDPDAPIVVDNLDLDTVQDVEVRAGCAFIAAYTGIALASVAPSGRMALLSPPVGGGGYFHIATAPPFLFVGGNDLAVFVVE